MKSECLIAEELMEEDQREYFEDFTRPRVLVTLLVGDEELGRVDMLLDSGAEVNLVSKRIAQKFQLWKKSEKKLGACRRRMGA